MTTMTTNNRVEKIIVFIDLYLILIFVSIYNSPGWGSLLYDWINPGSWFNSYNLESVYIVPVLLFCLTLFEIVRQKRSGKKISSLLKFSLLITILFAAYLVYVIADAMVGGLGN